MKELIEKIKSKLGYKDTNFSVQEKDLIDVGLNLAIKELEDQESKPFNPTECGFDRLSENSNEYIKYVYDTKKEYYILVFHEKKNDEPAFLYINLFSEYKTKRSFSNLLPTMDVPNHRFGVELLKNLRIIP